jgi:NAD(P)-dependent dehydrogenase (short-subunit alcohol dehydrogenase family)
MIEGGEEGWVVNTSSRNGGFQPLADLGVYAASKAAVTAYTECLANALANEHTPLHAALFYSGGNARDPAVEQREEPPT